MQSSNSNITSEIFKTNAELCYYKQNYDALHNSYFKICKLQEKSLNALLENSTKIPLPEIESLLDNYAIKVARKKDTYEKISTLEGICEGNEVFLIKRWKRKCRFLLEMLIDIYKSYETVHAKVHNSQIAKTDLESIKMYLNFIIANSKLNLETNSLDKWDIYIRVSKRFLLELLLNYKNYKHELSQQKMIKDRLFYVLKKAKDQRAKLKTYVSNLRDEIQYIEQRLRESADILKSKCVTDEIEDTTSVSYDNETYCITNNSERADYENRISELEKIIKEEEKRRKQLHNQFQELIGNTRVFCKIKFSRRPCLKLSNDDKIILSTDLLPEKLRTKFEDSAKCFIFDKVFGMDISHEEIFSSIDSLITSFIDGYNVGIMAYGQMGSGKTYTMFGGVDNVGINTLCIRQSLMKCNSRTQWNYKVSLSAIEIFKEEVFDLLIKPQDINSDVISNKVNNAKIVLSEGNFINFYGVKEKYFTTEHEAAELLKVVASNRVISDNYHEIINSKSHMLIFIKVVGYNSSQKTKSCGLLTLCDLAGSDSLYSTRCLEDHALLNKSLISLARVFGMLKKGDKPSYRDSKLTQLLKPSLDGDSKCVLFINVRSEIEFIQETLNSLEFGQSALQIVSNKKFC